MSLSHSRLQASWRAVAQDHPLPLLANGEHLEPTLGEFKEGMFMTRFFSHLVLVENGDGALEPVAEELPEPVAPEPGEA